MKDCSRSALNKRISSLNQKKKRNKSTTKRPISQDDRCSFNLRVFCWDDNSWYLRPLACHDQPFHCKHVKLSHTKIPASLIPEETRTLIQDATISLVDTSAVRRMVLNRYDLHVSNEQIRTIRKKNDRRTNRRGRAKTVW